jgi:hypothetical protein
MGEGGDPLEVEGAADAGDALVSSQAQPMQLFGGSVPSIIVRLGEPGLLHFLDSSASISATATPAPPTVARRGRFCTGAKVTA